MERTSSKQINWQKSGVTSANQRQSNKQRQSKTMRAKVYSNGTTTPERSLTPAANMPACPQQTSAGQQQISQLTLIIDNRIIIKCMLVSIAGKCEIDL